MSDNLSESSVDTTEFGDGGLPEKIRDAITEGVYFPGEKLTERELCERFSSSRPSVREAIRQLQGEGLLEVAPHRRPIVRRIDVPQFLNLHEVRVALFRLAAASFARQRMPEHIEALERCIDDFQQALASRDVPRIRMSKHQLFEAFTAGSQNEQLAAFIRHINARLGFLWASSLNHPSRPAESIEEWRRLLDAIQEGDAESAQAAMMLQNQRAKAIGMHALELLTRQARTPR
jgi:DNA-binding GntR family transcriptional regulator